MQPLRLVSIGVPIYKRLEYLPNILRMVYAQDYPSIELIISDNGQNGTKVREIIEGNYGGAFKFRQNSSTVNMSVHLNQIIREASGDYFHLLNDDDEISPNFVSELVYQLELYPEATLAYARLEIINTEGRVLRKSTDDLPAILSGPDFIRATWQRYEFKYWNLEGFLARRKTWEECGGYPEFNRGYHTDNAAVIRLCLEHQVAFSAKCVYRHRAHPEGESQTASTEELATASREFLRWLNHDRTMRRFAAEHPDQGQDVRQVLVRMIWETYLGRWRDSYQHRSSSMKWARDAFRMPFIRGYYKKVGFVALSSVKTKVKATLRRRVQQSAGFCREKSKKKKSQCERQ